MPLNIDWQQILLHLFNFFILALGLYLILYKPIKTFMESRQRHFADLEAQTTQKLEEAEAQAKEEKAAADALKQQVDEIKEKAAREAQEEGRLSIEKAKKEAERILAEAQEQAVKKQETMLLQAEGEIKQMTFAAIENLASGTDEEIDKFIEAVGHEKANE